MKAPSAILLGATFARHVVAVAVFAHYMVGSITQKHAETDIQNAINVGFDAFALNLMSLEAWSTEAVDSLFTAAEGTNFKLFFSFDMSHFTDPAQFLPILKQYVNHDGYYLYDSKPFVSTFVGGQLTFGLSSPNAGWQNSFKAALSDAGVDVFFVPDFDDTSGYPDSFFDTFTVVDGAFSWESAWPYMDAGFANVSDTVDSTMIEAAHNASKIYMMPLSTFQFKHLDTINNWYRRGESNLYIRMGQILALHPDLVEVITWNDSGEGHYVGNFWNESLGDTNIAEYAGGFDHTGWQQVISPFITAYKNGASHLSEITASSNVGVIWYRTLLTTSSCSDDPIGLPTAHEDAQDAINYAIILPYSGSNYTINVYSNNNLIGTAAGVTGLNGGSVLGLAAGRANTQRVDVVEVGSDGTTTTIVAATGAKDVMAETSGICNYNYEVVAMSGDASASSSKATSTSAISSTPSTSSTKATSSPASLTSPTPKTTATASSPTGNPAADGALREASKTAATGVSRASMALIDTLPAVGKFLATHNY
ncbi:hypothetical protein EYB26_007305 [Talaromyces marneffei]|uniref:uncharacterized protein n=1 Tax=Talaromyces marneffei TaxID=37727 RepID=UPI0012A78995|nr:uncharacterized protein EYB26_007305 [Talaromyces marneffei]QGA19616.1 hypothetical protein EYB26_007305 [Talaromyces marneffei]